MSKSAAAQELWPFVRQQPGGFCVFSQLCKSDAESGAVGLFFQDGEIP